MSCLNFRLYRPTSQRQLDAAVDDLAELLSTDRYTLAEIAGIMSMTVGSVCVLLTMLCDRYGEVAAA